MSLKAKLFIVLSLVTALYVGLTYGIQRFVIFPSFVLHERDEATSALQRCQDAIRREIYHLDLFCRDWAAWDDTYAFVEDRNPQYAQSNLLDETFTGNGLNLIYVVASDGTVVWGKILDLETEEEVELQQFPVSTFPAGHPLLAHDTTDSSISGIIQTDLGPMLFASRPIITSEDEGPIRGSLLMGRRVDEAFVEMIAEQSDVDLQLWSVQDESLPADASSALALMGDDGQPFLREQGENELAAYATLPDLYALDTPSLLLRTTIPREITAQGATVLRFAQISIVVAGLIVMAVTLLLMQKTIIGPLTRLTEHTIAIGQSGDLSRHLSLSGNDEIGILASEFDRMVDQLDEARRRLLDQSYYSGMAEMAAGALHNIRNVLTTAFPSLDDLRLRLAEVPVGEIAQASSELAQDHLPHQRRFDLARFLQLASQRLTAVVEGASQDIARLTKQAGLLEEILMQQDEFARASRPIEAVKLSDAIDDALGTLPAKFTPAVHVEVDPSVREVPPAAAQRILLIQVLGNLVTNALEAVEQAGEDNAKVLISAHVDRSNGTEMLHIRVEDNGIGLEPGQLEQMFERGYSTKRLNGSWGLGLHWSSGAVSAMSGRLYAESEGIGKGACLNLVLPATVGAAS